MAYPTITVGTAKPTQTLINQNSFVGPVKPQPQVVVGPAKPTAKITVGQAKPTQTIKNIPAQASTAPMTVTGASPFQEQPRTAFQSYWKLLTEPVIAPSRIGLSLTKSVLQGTARSGAAVAIEAAKGQEKLQQKVFGNVIGIPVQPSVYNKYLYGETPVTGFQGEGASMFSAFGADGLSKNKTASFALGAVLAGLDFTPGGKGDDLVKTLAKSDDVTKIVKALTNNKIASEVATEYAPVLAKTTNQTEVKQILEQISRVTKNTDSIIDPMSGLKKLNITDEARKVIDDNVEVLKPKLEKLKGAPMTAKEVGEAATKSDVLKKVITREESLRNVAQVQKTRESIAALAEGKGIKKEFAEQLLALKSQMSDTARKLRAAGFDANAVEVNSKADIINKLTEAGIEIDDVIKASENVDFNSPKQVAKFYRQFIKPSFFEKLDEWRYGNMLSSPLTHMINITSNAIQATVLNPATKLASGLADNVASKLFGKEQEHFIREAPQAYRGMANSFGTALNEAYQVFRGNKALRRLDLNKISTGSKITAVQRQFLQALEAGDAFFRTLIKGGEMESLASKYTKMGKEFTQETLEKEADSVAEYFTFRQGLDISNKEGQGALLSGIDKLTNAVMKARDNKLFGWFVPFVQTPMNILKQGIEYSPAGILTLPKNANKVQQLGKTMVGTTVFAGAGYLALNNRTSWGVPTNEQEKELFYASGMQPYSVKIGDKWFSYSKLGPLAYPIAMAAAIKYYWQDNPKAVDQNTSEKLIQIIGGVAKFFGDQSYVQGIGELGGVFQGQGASRLIQTLENMGGQIVPLSSLQRWVNNIIDPVFRKTESKLDLDNILKNLQAQMITQSDIQEPYTKPDGSESKRPFPFLNALNPFKASKEDTSFKEKYDLNNELQKLGVKKKANDEDEKARIEPILDHVTQLEEQGKVGEAQQIKDSLSEDDWNTYKKIRQNRRDKIVADSKPEMLKVYQEVTRLEELGQKDEAQRIKDSLTEEEWSAYKSIRNLVEGAN